MADRFGSYKTSFYNWEGEFCGSPHFLETVVATNIGIFTWSLAKMKTTVK